MDFSPGKAECGEGTKGLDVMVRLTPVITALERRDGIVLRI